MNYFTYEVKGVYLPTKRERTKFYDAKSEEDARSMAIQDGISTEMTITIIPFPKPTLKQLEYAADLGIVIPDEACQYDVSELIRNKEEDDKQSRSGLIEFADKKGLQFSMWIGEKSLANLIFNSLDEVDKIAFFVYSIYRHLSDDQETNLDNSIHKDILYKFSEDKVNDIKFMKSMNKYSGSNLIYFGQINIIEGDSLLIAQGASTNTYAYTQVSTFLHDTFGLNRTLIKTITIH